MNTLRTKIKLLSLNREPFTLEYEGYLYRVTTTGVFRYDEHTEDMYRMGFRFTLIGLDKGMYWKVYHNGSAKEITQAIQVIKLYELGERLKSW